ncbi:hypothetical protein BDW67DRAFT_185047 [Aspergillus spinulosporus]
MPTPCQSSKNMCPECTTLLRSIRNTSILREKSLELPLATKPLIFSTNPALKFPFRVLRNENQLIATIYTAILNTIGGGIRHPIQIHVKANVDPASKDGKLITPVKVLADLPIDVDLGPQAIQELFAALPEFDVEAGMPEPEGTVRWVQAYASSHAALARLIWMSENVVEGNRKPSSVHDDEPDDATAPHVESSAPPIADQRRGGTESFAKRSVSDIRKTFQGPPSNNGRNIAAQKSRIPRLKPSSATQVEEGSTKSAANIHRLSRAPLLRAAEVHDEYPDEGIRTPRQPHHQGPMRDALDKPGQETMAPHRSSKAGSSPKSRTPINGKADLPSQRRDPSPCQSRPFTINYKTYDALHGRCTASDTPPASPRIGPRMSSTASSCHPSRAPSINREAILKNENKGARTPRASCMSNPDSARGDAHGWLRDSTASPRRPTGASFLENIEDKVGTLYACRTQRDVQEHASCRPTVVSSLQSSHAPSVNSPEEEIKAQYACRARIEEKQRAIEQGSDPDSAASSCPTSCALHNLEQEVEAEYAYRAAIEQKQVEEHQFRRSFVVSLQQPPYSFIQDDIEAEIEAAYARRKRKEAGGKQARRESVSGSRRLPRVSNNEYTEKQIKAEYACYAQEEAKEQQSRRSSVASSRSSSQIPAISIEEVEALARPPAYQSQVPGPDGDGAAAASTLFLLLSPVPKDLAASSLRSPMLPRYEYEENQFPAYPASRNSVRTRYDSRSSSRDESNIHPAFRDKPYFGPSSPHHGSRAQTPDQRKTETRSGSSTNSRKCSTMDSLCSECCNVLKAIRPNVSDRYLECPPNIHPVIMECVLTGTSDDAVSVVRDLHKRIIRYTSRHFYLHAAARRLATSGRRSGRWYEIKTDGLPHSRACSASMHYDNKGPGTIQKVFYSPYSWAKKQEKKHIKETHVKLRNIQILMDFPWQIERGGMIEKKILDSLPKNVKLIKLEHIKAHHTFHRLEWWAKTHPVHHYTKTS